MRAVLRHVLLRDLPEGLADGLDHLEAALIAHGRDREVGVAARAVPVALLGLRAQGADAAVELRDALHDVAGNGEVVAHLDAPAGADLVPPLSRHHLCVDAGDLHTNLQTLLVAVVGHRPADGLAVAGASGGGRLRARSRPTSEIEKVILLRSAGVHVFLGEVGVFHRVFTPWKILTGVSFVGFS